MHVNITFFVWSMKFKWIATMFLFSIKIVWIVYIEILLVIGAN